MSLMVQPTMEFLHFLGIDPLLLCFLEDVGNLPHAVHPIVEQSESSVLLEVRNRVDHFFLFLFLSRRLRVRVLIPGAMLLRCSGLSMLLTSLA